jgi:hypothetical protein
MSAQCLIDRVEMSFQCRQRAIPSSFAIYPEVFAFAMRVGLSDAPDATGIQREPATNVRRLRKGPSLNLNHFEKACPVPFYR